MKYIIYDIYSWKPFEEVANLYSCQVVGICVCFLVKEVEVDWGYNHKRDYKE